MTPDWMKTRVAVAVLALVTPIYFIMLVLFLPFTMEPFSHPVYDALFHYIIAPAVFSAPWLGFMYFDRHRLANTVYIMEDTTTAVPLRWRVFYGTNAVFVLMLFILPLITAPLAIVGGLLVAGRVFYTIGIGKLGGGKPAAVLAVVVAIGLCIFPTIVMIQFIPNYLLVWESILTAWSEFWLLVVYGIAQCLVNALSFGAPIYFIYYGAAEYDRGVYGEVYTKTPTRWIRLGEFLIFSFFLFLYLPPIPTPFGTIPFQGLSSLFNSYINWISLGIVVIMILVKMRLRVENDTTMGGASNIFIIGLFLVVELFYKTDFLIITLIIWLAFLLFAAVTALSYSRASPREMY
ncbi:MAG: hypothetical protein RTU30_09300 [Candidatus Thorarchaeota archaeon]